MHGQRYLHRANCEHSDAIDTTLDQNSIEPIYPNESERDDWIQSLALAGLGCAAMTEFAANLPGLVLVPLVSPQLVRKIEVVSVRGRPCTAPVSAMVLAAKQFAWPVRSRVVPGVN